MTTRDELRKAKNDASGKTLEERMHMSRHLRQPEVLAARARFRKWKAENPSDKLVVYHRREPPKSVPRPVMLVGMHKAGLSQPVPVLPITRRANWAPYKRKAPGEAMPRFQMGGRSPTGSLNGGDAGDVPARRLRRRPARWRPARWPRRCGGAGFAAAGPGRWGRKATPAARADTASAGGALEGQAARPARAVPAQRA